MIYRFALWYNIMFVQHPVHPQTDLITDLCPGTVVKSNKKPLISDYFPKVKNKLSYLTGAVFCNWTSDCTWSAEGRPSDQKRKEEETYSPHQGLLKLRQISESQELTVAEKLSFQKKQTNQAGFLINTFDLKVALVEEELLFNLISTTNNVNFE